MTGVVLSQMPSNTDVVCCCMYAQMPSDADVVWCCILLQMPSDTDVVWFCIFVQMPSDTNVVWCYMFALMPSDTDVVGVAYLLGCRGTHSPCDADVTWCRKLHFLKVDHYFQGRKGRIHGYPSRVRVGRDAGAIFEVT